MATPTTVTSQPAAFPHRCGEPWLRSDSSVACAAAAGREEAWDELVARFGPLVKAVARRYARNPADADDIAQDAWLCVFRRINTYRGTSAFRTWLYRVTVNTALMRVRRQSAVQRAEARYVIHVAEQARPLPERCQSIDRRLLDGLLALPPGRRRVLWLIVVHGLSTGEVALRCRIAPVTVRTQYLRARRALRVALGRCG